MARDDDSVGILEISSKVCKLPMVRLKTQNDLEIALRQNKWLGEILERFKEVALPDSWLVAGCIAQTSGICVANNRPSLASKMSTSYISMNKIYR